MDRELTKKFGQYCADIIDSSYVINEEGDVQIDLESTDKVCKVMHTYAEVSKEETALVKVKAETTVDTLAHVFDVAVRAAAIGFNVHNLCYLLKKQDEGLMPDPKGFQFIKKS